MKKKKWLTLALAMSAALAGCGAAGGNESAASGNSAQATSGSADAVGALSSAASSDTAVSARAAKSQSETVNGGSVVADSQAPDATSGDVLDRPIRVQTLKGPTAMGMVQMMADEAHYSFDIAAAPDLVTPNIAKGETDIAAVPANLAAVLYQKTNHQVEVLAVNTLGVLYICETGDSVHSVADLKGKTIYASGKGATPEYGLRYLLQANGLDPDKDVTIEWKSEHSECVAAITQDPSAAAMLPQPFVTVAQTKNDKLHVAIDMSKEWEALQTGEQKSAMIAGVVIARKEFVEQYPAQTRDFLDAYAASVDFTNEHIDEAAELIAAHDIVPAPVAKKAIPSCNIVCITGSEMKDKLSGYLQVLADQNPQAVGGQVPDEAFYYTAE